LTAVFGGMGRMMKLSTENLGPLERGEVAVGNVYAAKGGKASQRDDTKYWAVVAVKEHGVSLLGLDAEGHVVTTANYLKHAVSGRQLVGRVPGLATVVMEIEP
jgi:hypothetical protein